MAVSSSNLLHFTNSLEIIISIINKGFYARYSKESFSHMLSYRDEKQFIYIPCVCFCDIPLNQITEHVIDYGKYALALNREWGMKNGISPVVYSYTDCLTVQHYTNIWSNLLKVCKQHEKDPYSAKSHAVQGFFEFNGFVKQYNGVSHKSNKEKIFYNEREWRYVPPFQLTQIETHLYHEELVNKDDYTKNLEMFPLRFEYKDVKYILVKNEIDKNNLIQYLENNERITIEERKHYQTNIYVYDLLEKDGLT